MGYFFKFILKGIWPIITSKTVAFFQNSKITAYSSLPASERVLVTG